MLCWERNQVTTLKLLSAELRTKTNIIRILCSKCKNRAPRMVLQERCLPHGEGRCIGNPLPRNKLPLKLGGWNSPHKLLLCQIATLSPVLYGFLHFCNQGVTHVLSLIWKFCWEHFHFTSFLKEFTSCRAAGLRSQFLTVGQRQFSVPRFVDFSNMEASSSPTSWQGKGQPAHETVITTVCSLAVEVMSVIFAGAWKTCLFSLIARGKDYVKAWVLRVRHH